VFGSRFAVHEYRRVLMFRHQLGNKFLTLLTNLVSNLNLTDMETCYKAVRTGLLKSIPIRSNDYRIEPEITIKLARRNARIYEIPINYSGRTYQEGKKIDWRDGFKAIWAIVAFAFSDDVFVEDEYGSRILSRLSRADKLNSWMADTIRPYVGQNVLEIGSGMGNITKKLIPRAAYHATDINPFYLEFMNRIKTDKPYLSVSYLDLNHISGLEGEGKGFDTVICLNVIEHLDDDEAAMKNISNLLHDNGRAIIFESESAITSDMIKSRGIGPDRVLMLPIISVQDFRNQATQLIDDYLETPKEERIPIIVGLDSLGNLTTTKEINDAQIGGGQISKRI
jgi:ubiquinone/menaquinone biosynthesis C-methylase UbiE